MSNKRCGLQQVHPSHSHIWGRALYVCPGVQAASSPSRPAPRDAEQVIADWLRKPPGDWYRHEASDAPTLVAALSAAGYLITPKALLDEYVLGAGELARGAHLAGYSRDRYDSARDALFAFWGAGSA